MKFALSLPFKNITFESFKKYSRGAVLLGILAVVIAVTIFGGRFAASQLARASTCSAKNVQAVQVGANSAVISWTSDEDTQGRVQYSVDENTFPFSTREGSSSKEHNVPLTLLTPNTVYYYQLVFGTSTGGATKEISCDSTGGICTKNCVPWSFTTAVSLPLKVESLPSVSPTTMVPAVPTPTVKSLLPTPALTLTAQNSSCEEVEQNIGATSSNASTWARVKQYDMDGNGIINGLDVVKCEQSSK